MRCHQPSRRVGVGRRARGTRAVSFGRIFFASPTIGMCAGTFFEISAGSTSMWMNFARGANSDSLPVMRSSKRAPIAHDQVGLVHRVVRGARAVHAEHAEPLLVVGREGAEAHQRAGDREAVRRARARGAPWRASALIDAAAARRSPAGARWRAPSRPGGSAWRCPRWWAGSPAGARSSTGSYGMSARERSCGMSTSTGPGRPGARDVERLVDRLRDLARVLDHGSSA